MQADHHQHVFLFLMFVVCLNFCQLFVSKLDNPPAKNRSCLFPENYNMNIKHGPYLKGTTFFQTIILGIHVKFSGV